MHAVTYPTTLWYQHTSIGTPPQKKSCYRLQYCLWFLLLTTNCSIFDIKTNQTVETLIFSMANIKDSRNQLYVDSKILLRPIFTCMLIITYYRELWIVSSPPKKTLDTSLACCGLKHCYKMLISEILKNYFDPCLPRKCGVKYKSLLIKQFSRSPPKIGIGTYLDFTKTRQN